MTTSNAEDVPKASLLKAPAVEVIDLLSDTDSNGLVGEIIHHGEKRKREDEAEEVVAVQDEDDDDTSDEEPWESESLYEDALEGLGDEQLNGEQGSSGILRRAPDHKTLR